ncbi:MAG TPA: hypothetical protein VM659_05910 [Dongiaceae bacterium]|nr:hypothetical protein [Dongiaceae bacterium]
MTGLRIGYLVQRMNRKEGEAMRNKAIATGLFALGLLATMSPAARSDEIIQGFHDGCMKSMIGRLQQSGTKIDDNVQQMVSNYCDCAQNHIRSGFTPAELQALQQPNPDPALIARMEPIKQQCSKENFHQ